MKDFQQISGCLLSADIYAESAPFELLLNFPSNFSKLKPTFGQASDPTLQDRNIIATKYTNHNYHTQIRLQNVKIGKSFFRLFTLFYMIYKAIDTNVKCR